MMRRFLILLGVLAGVGGTAWADDDKAPQEGLRVGEPAPAFSLAGSDGKTHTLEGLLAEGAVVIAWFPKAFTGG